MDDSGLRWIVTDACSGFDHEAVLRWRLCTGTGDRKALPLLVRWPHFRFIPINLSPASSWDLVGNLNTTVKVIPACAGDLCWSSPSYANNFFSPNRLKLFRVKVLSTISISQRSSGCWSRSYALAKSMVEAGHQVQMVCLRHDLTHTGLSDPFINGRRSGLVDGIEVVEFDLHLKPCWFVYTCTVFLRYSWYSLSLGLDSDADLVFATTTPPPQVFPESWLGGSEALLSCLRFVTYGPSFPSHGCCP